MVSRIALATLLCTMLCADRAGAVSTSIQPSNDATVSSLDPNMTFDPEVVAGVGGPAGPVELHGYLRFALPSLEPGTRVSSALLTGTLRVTPVDINDEDYELRFVSDDTWDETTLTWSNSPGSTATLASFDPTGLSAGQGVSFDVSARAELEYTGDGKIGFHLTPTNSSTISFNAVEWVAKEQLGDPFRLDVEVVPNGYGHVVKWANAFGSESNVVGPANCLGVADDQACELGPSGGTASIAFSQFQVSSAVSEIDLRGVDFIALEVNAAGDLDFESSTWVFSDGQSMLNFTHTKGAAAAPGVSSGNLAAAAYATQFGSSCGAADATCSFLLFDLTGLDTSAGLFSVTVSASGGTDQSPELVGLGVVGIAAAPALSPLASMALGVALAGAAAIALGHTRRRPTN